MGRKPQNDLYVYQGGVRRIAPEKLVFHDFFIIKSDSNINIINGGGRGNKARPSPNQIITYNLCIRYGSAAYPDIGGCFKNFIS